jgi:hypothetical protein
MFSTFNSIAAASWRKQIMEIMTQETLYFKTQPHLSRKFLVSIAKMNTTSLHRTAIFAPKFSLIKDSDTSHMCKKYKRRNGSLRLTRFITRIDINDGGGDGNEGVILDGVWWSRL